MNGNGQDQIDAFYKEAVELLFEKLEDLKKLAHYDGSNDPSAGFEIICPRGKSTRFQGIDPKGQLVFTIEVSFGVFKVITINREGYINFVSETKFGYSRTKLLIIYLAGALIHEISWENAE